MKIKFMLCIMLISARTSFAQENKLWLSLGAGLDNTANAGKNYAMSNGFNIQADAYIPFYKKGWNGSVKGSGFTLGMNITGNYAGIRNPRPDNTVVTNRYQVYGGNIAVADQAEGKISGSFSGLAGIQARVDLGKFNLSPSVNLGYLLFKQKGYVQTGSLSMNGQTQQKDLVISEQQSTSGLLFKPQLKIGYSIARNLSFFVSPSMVFGPEIRHTTYYLIPQGGFNDKNTYEAGQLAKGTMEHTINTGRYRIMEFNAGITISIAKKKQDMPGRLSMTPTTTRQTQGKTFGEKAAQGMAANNGDNPLYQGSTASGENPMYEANKISGNNPVYKGNTTSGVNPVYNPDKQAMPGSPIGGIVVKGGKNPGGNHITLLSDNNGEVLLNNLEAGEYLFQLSRPELPAEKSINEKGVKRSESVVMAQPGSPIGGIVVKAGKNPGGNFTSLTVDSNGQIGFEVLEAGNYKLIIAIPDANQPATENNNKSKGKTKEKATSGLKDILKTNV